MLFFVFAGLWVLVPDNEVNLRVVSFILSLVHVQKYLIRCATLVRAKHDNVGRRVGELFGVELLVVLEQLHVGSTTLQSICTDQGTALSFRISTPTLKFDLILDNKCLCLVVDLLGKLCRDGVVGGRILDDKSFVTLNALKGLWLLNSPFANVGPIFFAFGIVLLGPGDCPP